MAKKIPFLFILLILHFLARSQSTFFKSFIPNDYEAFKQVVNTPQGGYVFITDKFFYKTDARGNLLLKKEIKEGASSYLSSIQPIDNGGYWIVSHIFETVDIQKLKLYKIDADGNIVSSKDLGQIYSVEIPTLTKGSGNNFYLSYQHRENATVDGHLDIIFFDGNGNKIWQKEMPQTLYISYAAQPGINGSVNICYMTKDDLKMWVLSVDDDANTNMQEIHFQQPANKLATVTNFCKAIGDGYIFIGNQIDSNNGTDLLVFKTSLNGTVEWVKIADIYLNDQAVGIAATSNGYIVLANTGNQGWGDEVGGDICIMKTDLQGNQQWQKGYGSAKSDYATQLVVNTDGSLVIGGRASYPGQVVPITMLCKTDTNGNIASSLPFQLAAATDMKLFTTTSNSPIQHLVQAAPASNTGFLLGINALQKSSNSFIPTIVKSDKNGQEIWNKKLLATAGNLKTIRQIKDGNYIAITEQKDVFGNICKAFKINTDGDTLWSCSFFANNIKDVIGTTDGGCLITGALDISFVNYEVFLLRLDGGGKQLWQKTFGERGVWETGRRIVETPDNGFLIVGSTQKEFDLTSDIHMLKINKDGNKVFAKNFSGGIATNLGFDVAITVDNNYLVAGTECKQPFDNKNIILLKTDAQGNEIWQKTIDMYLLDEGLCILAQPDGGFYITGTTGEPNAGKLEKYAYVLRMDKNGNKLWGKYYGLQGYQTTATTLLPAANNKAILLGNTQQQYAEEKMFFVPIDTAATVEEPTADSLLIYPNPATKTGTQLFISNNYTGTIQVLLYNALGKLVKVLNSNKSASSYNQQLSLYGLSGGIYFVVVAMGEEKHVRKLWLN